CPERTQGLRKRTPRILRIFLFSTFPQRFVQPVEDLRHLSTGSVSRLARASRTRCKRADDDSFTLGRTQDPVVRTAQYGIDVAGSVQTARYAAGGVLELGSDAENDPSDAIGKVPTGVRAPFA